MRRFMWGFVAVVGATIGGGLSVQRGFAQGPERPQGDHIRRLIEQAEQAAAEGRDDEAQELADEAKHQMRRAQAEREDRLAERPDGPPDEGPDGPPHHPGPPRGDGDAGPDGPKGDGGGPGPDRMRKFQEAYQKIREMNRHAHELEEAGKTEEAQKVREEMRAMGQKLGESFPRPDRGPGGPNEGQMGELYKKVADLRKQIHDAEEAGDQKKADELRHQAHDMMRKAMEEHMRGRGGEGSGQAGPDGGPREGGRHPDGPSFSGQFRGMMHGMGTPGRADRVRMAASLLESAGFADDAKHVRELAKQIPKEEPKPDSSTSGGSADERRGPAGDHRHEGRRPGPPPGEGGPRPEEVKAQLDRLQEQVRRLSEQIKSQQGEKNDSHDNGK